MNPPPILLGTSSFTATGWNGSFYPRGMKPTDYLAFYAERFHTVEVDSTFYACPTARTVENWKARTPEGFIFSVKVPQTITHKAVVDRTTELSSWVDYCCQIKNRGVLVYAYANNHYAGHAPATIEQFRNLWQAKGLPELSKPSRMRPKESLLFE